MTHYVVMDIVKHLRMNAEDFRYDNADDYASHGVLMLSAADEIERLRVDYANVASSKELLELDYRKAKVDLAEAEALLLDIGSRDWWQRRAAWWKQRDAWLARRRLAMSDIVERLLEAGHGALADEAAHEIEELRDERDFWMRREHGRAEGTDMASPDTLRSCCRCKNTGASSCMYCRSADEIERLRNKVAALLPREGMPPYTVLLQELAAAEALLRKADPSEHCATTCDYCVGVKKEIDAWLARRSET